MTSVFPVEMLGVLRMTVDIPLFSVWGRGRKELLGGGEVRNLEALPHNFSLLGPMFLLLN